MALAVKQKPASLRSTPEKSRLSRPRALGLLPSPAANGKAAASNRQTMSLTLAQFAPRKGDVDANLRTIEGIFRSLESEAADFPDVVVFPETCLSGYFVEGAAREVALSAEELNRRLQKIARAACGRKATSFDVVIGFYEDDGGKLYNSAAYLTLGPSGGLRHIHRKLFLPTYGIFDEERFVSRGRSINAFDTPHGRACVLICEDACHAVSLTVAALRGAQVIYIPSASPGRGLEASEPANVRLWRDITRVAAAEHGVFVAYAGLIGFEGGKGFTGASKIVGPFGDLRIEAPFDSAAIARATISLQDVSVARAALPALGDLESNLAEFSAMFEQEMIRRPERRGRHAKS